MMSSLLWAGAVTGDTSSNLLTLLAVFIFSVCLLIGGLTVLGRRMLLQSIPRSRRFDEHKKRLIRLQRRFLKTCEVFPNTERPVLYTEIDRKALEMIETIRDGIKDCLRMNDLATTWKLRICEMSELEGFSLLSASLPSILVASRFDRFSGLFFATLYEVSARQSELAKLRRDLHDMEAGIRNEVSHRRETLRLFKNDDRLKHIELLGDQIAGEVKATVRLGDEIVDKAHENFQRPRCLWLFRNRTRAHLRAKSTQ